MPSNHISNTDYHAWLEVEARLKAMGKVLDGIEEEVKQASEALERVQGYLSRELGEPPLAD